MCQCYCRKYGRSKNSCGLGNPSAPLTLTWPPRRMVGLERADAPAYGARVTRSRRKVAKTWNDLALDIRAHLESISADDLEIRIPVKAAANTHVPDFVMHVTYVQASTTDVENWIVTFVRKQAVLDDLLPTNPVTLAEDFGLPFRAPPEICEGVVPLVWRPRSAAQAEARLREILEEHLHISPERPHLSLTECTTIELERRLDVSTVTRRLQARRASGSLARAVCDRCGLPLSDRESVRLGIGPECRKYYLPEVLQAVSRSDDMPPQRSGVTKEDWIAMLRGWAAFVPQTKYQP
jgi:hypothetical protein